MFSGLSKKVGYLSIVGLLLTASPSFAVTNLVVNGNFSLGDVDFSSGYEDVTGLPGLV
jgi:hypothetical protein